jgi:hypothetical protein
MNRRDVSTVECFQEERPAEANHSRSGIGGSLTCARRLSGEMSDFDNKVCRVDRNRNGQLGKIVWPATKRRRFGHETDE